MNGNPHYEKGMAHVGAYEGKRPLAHPPTHLGVINKNIHISLPQGENFGTSESRNAVLSVDYGPYLTFKNVSGIIVNNSK